LGKSYISNPDSKIQNPTITAGPSETAPATSVSLAPAPKSGRFQKSALFNSKIVQAIIEEVGYIVKGLSAWPLAALVVLAALGLALAYQAPVDWSFQLGTANPADYLYIQSFNPPEDNGQLSFRWSSDDSYLRFPGAGRLPSAQIEIEMYLGGRPANLAPPRVQLWEGSRLLGEYQIRLDQSRYVFEYRAQGRDLIGSPVFTLRTVSPFTEKNHNLPLGVVVSAVRLTGGPGEGRPVIPALPHYFFLLAGLVIFYLGLARAGWSYLLAAGMAGGLALAAGYALAFYRFHLTPAVEPLFLTLALAYPLLVLGLRTTRGWLGRRGQIMPLAEARWVGLIFVSAFVVKAVGLNHPVFHPVDHWFRIHQINRFWEYPAAFWQQYYNVSTGTTVTGQEGGSAVLGQWGVQVSLPYSPLFYIFAAPLSLIWPAHNDPNLLVAVNLLASWLEISQVFLLYILLRRAYSEAWAGRAGIIAAAIFGFYPLSFLLFSDGGYNSIFAGWLSLLFITLLVDRIRLYEAGKGRVFSVWAVLALAAALLAHTSTLLLLGSLVVLFSLILLVSKRSRRIGWQVALVSGSGLGLAAVLYYGWYVPDLAGKTLPTLFNRLGSSGLGQDNKLLGTDLLSGFWPQLWEHFRLWPFLLTIVGFTIYDLRFTIYDLVTQRGLGIKFNTQEIYSKSANEEEAGSIVNRQSSIVNRFWWAWLAVFLIFALVDLKANLLQKHMLFAAPLLCIGSGLALSLAWERVKSWAEPRRATWALWILGAGIGGLMLWNVIQGLIVWYARVYYLTYQPGSG
jgi:hypothetical protein